MAGLRGEPSTWKLQQLPMFLAKYVTNFLFGSGQVDLISQEIMSQGHNSWLQSNDSLHAACYKYFQNLSSSPITSAKESRAESDRKKRLVKPIG